MGSRRIYLATQTDDVFLSTETWDPEISAGGTVPFRITPDDLNFNYNFSVWLNTVCFSDMNLVDSITDICI